MQKTIEVLRKFVELADRVDQGYEIDDTMTTRCLAAEGREAIERLIEIDKFDVDGVRPVTAMNWRGTACVVDYPPGRTVARVGPVFLIEQNKRMWHVVYGLFGICRLNYQDAVREFATCCAHALDCEDTAVVPRMVRPHKLD